MVAWDAAEFSIRCRIARDADMAGHRMRIFPNGVRRGRGASGRAGRQAERGSGDCAAVVAIDGRARDYRWRRHLPGLRVQFAYDDGARITQMTDNGGRVLGTFAMKAVG